MKSKLFAAATVGIAILMFVAPGMARPRVTLVNALG
jgi:hypothetical protein